MNCGLCNSNRLEIAYRPDSPRGLKVYICKDCDLVQSLPKMLAGRKTKAASAGADWGNLRIGKGYRTAACVDLLRRHVDLSKPQHVLDVGSSRGAFRRAVSELSPLSHIICVEPDETVAEIGHAMVCRIEDVRFPSGMFDVIHSCHTLEHVENPLPVLRDHCRTMHQDGLLILDVPNIEFLATPDIVEEWFIDKHLYHFSPQTLRMMVRTAGFEIVEFRPDDANILLAARRS